MPKITNEKVEQFQKITCASDDDAIAYLEAEEGFLDDAIISYRAVKSSKLVAFDDPEWDTQD